MTQAQLPLRPRPLPLGYPFYALIEAMGGDEEGDAAQFERVLSALIEEGGSVQNAVIAQSERERTAFWAVREDMQLGIAPMRPFASYDVSMGLSDMPGFVEAARRNVTAAFPDAQMIFYGHAGDGNLHAIVGVGAMDSGIQHTLDSGIFSAVRAVGGSISAEHGIGISRAPFLAWTRTPRELQLMRTLKQALDPQNILNPGKLLDACGDESSPS
jgi:FAD/FMN-containing dehydrogenase